MIFEILKKIDAEEVFDPFFKFYEGLPEGEKEGCIKESFDSAQELFWICKMNDEGLFDEVVLFGDDDGSETVDFRAGIAKKELGIDKQFAYDALERYMVIT